MREVDANYYGYLDDDDELLRPLEEKASKEALKKSIEEWKNATLAGKQNSDTPIDIADNDDSIVPSFEEDLAPKFVSHVAVPSQKDIEDALLRKKKRELMQQFGI